MVVLALETATRAGSVAIWRDGAVDARFGDGSRTHGERLPGEITSLLASHGLALHDVNVFAIVSGPGSFTGLRVGAATIQGLALASHRRIVAVPTLEAMADGWIARSSSNVSRFVIACLDGQRGDIFFAAWEMTDTPVRERGRAVVRPSVGKPEDLTHAVRAIGDTSVTVVVDQGANRYRDVFLAAVPTIDVAPMTFALAEVAVRTAAANPAAAMAPHAIRPVYIRRPDAELARERHRQKSPVAQADRLSIEHATEADLPSVDALQRRAFRNPWGTDAIRWELEHTDVARLYVMRTAEGTVVAYCACWMVFDELHINSLAVDEGWRRRGLAGRLLAHVFRESIAAGARSATLEVRQSNVVARALYEGLGFRVEAVRRDYYQDPREDALILWNRHLK